MVIWCCVHFGLKCGNSEKKIDKLKWREKCSSLGRKLFSLDISVVMEWRQAIQFSAWPF